MAVLNGNGVKLGELLTPDLVEAIAEAFPREPLNPNTPVNELWFREGQCSVAEILKAKYNEVQNKDKITEIL
jgi:hypothetical protein